MKEIQIADVLSFLDNEGYSYNFYGDPHTKVKGFSSLKNYKLGTFTWAKNDKAYQFNFTEKLFVIAQEGLLVEASNVLYSPSSKKIFFDVIDHFYGESVQNQGIGQDTYIGPNVRLGKNVVIGHHCVLDGDIEIGDNTRIWNQVTMINRVSIGNDCEIQSGCVFGHDGFGWSEDEKHNRKMIKHYGGVLISDNVYIGPNTVIDRGTIDCTTIGAGSRIDANCFIAHNVVIGKNALLVTGTRLYGSSCLGDNVYSASAMVRNQVSVGDNAILGMGCVVTKDIDSNAVVMGIPAKEKQS